MSENRTLSVFTDASTFEAGMRMAEALSKSRMIPADYQGKPENTLIAIEVAQRTGASPLAVMQNLYIVHGRPGWSAQYIIAAINASGKYSPLRFAVTGTGDERSCIAWATDRSGERLESPPVSIAMAKKEGWYGKNGSKWQTMPELMLRYRAATLFGRLYAPEILMGMRTQDEIEDIELVDITPTEAQESREVIDVKTGEVLRQELPDYPDEKLTENLDKWREAILAGKTNPQKIIAKITSTYKLSLPQAQRINALKEEPPPPMDEPQPPIDEPPLDEPDPDFLAELDRYSKGD